MQTFDEMPQRIFSGTIIGPADFGYLNYDPGLGAPVDRSIALSVPAVLHGRNLIAGTISTLPICVTDSANNEIRSPLLEQIDPDVPNVVTIAQTVEDLLFGSISYWRVLARDSAGFPTYARHVDYRYVSTTPPGPYNDILPSNFVPGSFVWISGVQTPARDVIRFDSPNPPLLTTAARAISRAIALETAAENMANNPQARQYFAPKDGADPQDTEVTDMLDAWQAARQIRSMGYVPAGFELKDGSTMSPVELQLMQLIEKNVLQLAAAMGLDPEDFGINTTTRTYKNAVDRRQDRINECFGPYAKAIEDRLSMGDITRRGQKVRLDWDDFLKANPLDRMTIQTGYLAAKVITADEIREDEGMPELTPTQKLELAPPPPPEPQVQPGQMHPGAPTNNLAVANQGSSAVTFSDDHATGFVFDVDIAETFSVNESKRTITGLVVPWNAVGRSGGQRWTFAKDSLKYSPGLINRIKLLSEHNSNEVIGRLEKTWSDDQGQWGMFKVARGAAGDEALASAADGIRDGLSVGIAHEGDGVTFSYSPHPADKTINHVTAAPWQETSLVAIPAFSGARVSAVQLAADQGVNMHCDKCGHEHAPNVACAPAPTAQPPAGVTYSAEQVAAMFAAWGMPQPATSAPVETPAVVSPVRETAQTQVTEQPMYRFDGGRGQRTFSGDLKLIMDGDAEAQTRINRYMQTDMAAQFTNLAPSDVASLNPVLTRPELYVPNLLFGRPLGSLVTLGGLNDLIAFIAPKFNTSSGLVGDHTTGTEPTGGSVTTTSQTITPKGLSGRVDIDREVVDSGGSPQADQIIWSELARAYNEKLETRIVVALEAATLSPTGTGITGTDTTLQTNLLNILTPLQFIRGGDSFRSLALSSTLYNPLVAAKDSNGRLLFPLINPMNSAGTTAIDLSTVQVANKVGVPAWALESTNGGTGKSYLFDREYVRQWASAPTRFDFTLVNVSSVSMAIWGYSAEAVTNTAKVRRLVYS